MQYYRNQELARRLGVSRATVWNWSKSGILPKPIKLGPRVTAWRKDEVEELIAKREAEKNIDS